MKINNFQGELTDISAKKEALNMTYSEKTTGWHLVVLTSSKNQLSATDVSPQISKYLGFCFVAPDSSTHHTLHDGIIYSARVIAIEQWFWLSWNTG